MGKVFIQESTLTSIADSIRSKKGTTDLIDPANMATEIASITTGGGGLPEEALTISGDCSYRFAYDGWNWFIEEYGNQITTNGITNSSYMFYNSPTQTIPFEINLNNLMCVSTFYNCKKLVDSPIIKAVCPTTYSNVDLSNLFYSCIKVSNLDNALSQTDLTNLSTIKVTSAYSCPKYNAVLDSCYSLRTLPSWFNQLRFSEESTVYPNYSYCLYQGFQSLSILDEVLNFPVLRCNGAATSNMFGASYNPTFGGLLRAKNIIFETQADGTPYTVKWKSQTIDLFSKFVGFSTTASAFTSYGSNITADKEVKDDATYQALKNDPDWFATSIPYSRYNHDSAVATINSLPDTSAYLATAGGTNTIKFRGASGSATDGGAINTLTEEEIAVATAKGWTVSLV